jgi:glutamate carboxypeptidase
MLNMEDLLKRWAEINTYSYNPEGINLLLNDLLQAFSILNPDDMRILTLGESKALFLKKRANAPIQIYFGGHLDTVFSLDQPFQKVIKRDEHTLNGPGVADMKGGLVVMLKAIEAFEKMENASLLGWEIVINSDEEIGSPYSTPFIEECAKKCHLACLFEPSLEDGSFVSERKGSSNYLVVSRGKKAHAGRNPNEGKNAIYPLAHFIAQIEIMNAPSVGTLLNVGKIEGGVATNIIPDYAECHLNVRADQLETMNHIEKSLEQYAKDLDLQLIRTTFRPPKPFDPKTEALFQALKECGSKLGLTINWRKSGGVCDGNTLASKNIPTIDTLGVRGGMIHTEKEFLYVESLSERAELTALFLSEIAAGKIKVHKDLSHDETCSR